MKKDGRDFDKKADLRKQNKGNIVGNEETEEVKRTL